MNLPKKIIKKSDTKPESLMEFSVWSVPVEYKVQNTKLWEGTSFRGACQMVDDGTRTGVT